MTDIVERARWLASGQDDPQSQELIACADEIERLREEVWLWTARCHSAIGLLPDDMVIGEIQKAAKEAEAKIERLREGVHKLSTVHRQRNEWGDRMMAENERLRAALWLIDNDAHSLDDAVKIARAALGEGKE